MKIKRRMDYEAWLRKKGKSWLEGEPRTEGIHVSNLLYPRKWFFRQMPEFKGAPLSDAELGYFVAGKSAHYFIEGMLVGKEHEGSDAGEFQWEGIYYSPDVKEPLIEVKSTRKRTPPPKASALLKTEFKEYLRQLIKYAAIMGKTTCHLVPFYINSPVGKGTKYTYPMIYWYEVKFTKKELAECRKEMLQTKKAMLRARNTGKHQKLEPCPEWQCGYNLGKEKEIIKCPYYEKCQPLKSKKRRK